MSGNVKKVTVYMPERIYKAAQHASSLVGQSASNFIVMATAQRVRNWRDPLSGEKVGTDVVGQIAAGKAAGWECDHPACAGSADRCKAPQAHQQDYWIQWDTDAVDPETGAMLAYKRYDGTVVRLDEGD